MAKRGRPAWDPPDMKVIEQAASTMISEEQICAALGICTQTLRRHKKINVEFCEAIKRGRALGIMTAATKLQKNVANGDQRAIEFLLERKGGFVKYEDAKIPDGMTPETMTDEQLRAVAEGRQIPLS